MLSDVKPGEDYTSSEFSTPMMQQYLAVKKQYQDSILLFRLGDFYEMFLEDAEIGSKILDIVLTSRTRGKDGSIPMCGVPYHAVDSYLSKLVKAGHKVAICEQLTEPGKGLVERKVVRVVTPGTLLDEQALDHKKNNYLMSLLLTKEHLAVAAVDVSTGDFRATQFPAANWQQQLATLVTKLAPSECLVSPEMATDAPLINILQFHSSPNVISYPHWPRTTEQAADLLQSHLNVATLDGFGLSDQPQAWQAAAVLLTYLEETQLQPITHLRQIRQLTDPSKVTLDRSTILNLELFTGLRSGSRQGSFIEFFDHTYTAMGGRCMKDWLIHPLATKTAIEQRLDAVELLAKNQVLQDQLTEHLKSIADIERIIAKLALKTGSPKDLVRLAHALHHIFKLKPILSATDRPILKQLEQAWPKKLERISQEISTTLVDDPPLDPKQGRLVRLGFHSELDTFLKTIATSQEWITNLEKTERDRTGIATLRVKFNKVFGFYIEVSKAQAEHVPENYQRKQTLVNAERFITPELKKHEEIVLTAQEKRDVLEYQIFLALVRKVLEQTNILQQAAQAVATLDCLVSMATVAATWNYTRPVLTTQGKVQITQGSHPVVEAALGEVSFVPNDTLLNHQDHQLLVLTGPNMAGKSVFMRQTALIVLMTHLGSFVPAQNAKISLVDHIFVRSGAADGITSGLSTFMVEMTEAAYILHHATDKSLVILDEIGRGTSTFDGISIAWAIAEYLVTHAGSQALTLFATHYHELQELETLFPEKIKNYQLMVANKNGEPIFVHTIVKGASPHSFGVAVAKLAGLPKQVTDKAQLLLKKFESKGQTSLPPANALTTPTTQPNLTPRQLQVLSELTTLNIDQLTPLEALNQLSLLQKEVTS